MTVKSGIVKVNNSLLEQVNRIENVDNLYYSVYFFSGRIPTKEEFDEYYTTETLIAGNKFVPKFLAGTPNEDRVFLAELRTERTYGSRLTAQEQVLVRLASDPQELVITKEGTPTWALITTTSSRGEAYASLNGSSVEWQHTYIASVGNVGSGEDIEIKDGVISQEVTYKLNSLRIRLEEI